LIRKILVLSLSALLAGCAVPASILPPATPAPPSRPAVRPAPAPAPPPAVKPRPAPAVTPESLKGLDESAASALLGPPARRDERPPARIWTYVSPRCRVELAFYPDVAARSFRVLSHELTPVGKQPATGADCLSGLKETGR
jgi:hypothetical protein